jgi:hypothetical protein
MPRSDFNSLALGTHLASGLGPARQKYVFVPYRDLAYVMAKLLFSLSVRSVLEPCSRLMIIIGKVISSMVIVLL